MRDVSIKANTLRTATATALLTVSPSTIDAIRTGNVPKADPVGVAKIAAIQAAKHTSLIIPYCHQVPLDAALVDIVLYEDSIVVTASVKAIWKTGVEMEALVAASTAALTLYDMLKIIDDTMEIGSVRLLEKTGGKSSMKLSGKGRNAAVLVLSDSVSKGKKEDRSGKRLAERLKQFGLEVLPVEVLPDECDRISAELKRLADDVKVDMIVTTGGTGVSPRDVTPEAALAVINRRLEGMESALLHYGQERLPTAMLSRSVVGIRGTTLIITLPGSPGGVDDGIDALFPAIFHTFAMLRGEGH